MSSDVVARMHAFTMKAEKLGRNGHMLRAAENYGRAAEAARPLGADNLATLSLSLQQGNMLSCYAAIPEDFSAVDARTRTAHRTEFIAMLSGAVEALERRRVAGTLLEGKCTAAEEAWQAGVLQQLSGCTAAAAAMASLIGYEVFYRAAAIASEVLARAQLFAPLCSDAYAQFLSFVQHVVHAAELMQQPRRHGFVTMEMEVEFALALRDAIARAGVSGLDARLAQQLTGAWQQLQRSGVLQARRIEENIAFSEPKHQAHKAAVESGMTAPGLRRCALSGCGAKEAHPAHFKSCAACRTVVYCCREHQVEGWPGHKKACKAARKAAVAAEKDGAGPSGA